jgi:hypothetical protein
LRWAQVEGPCGLWTGRVAIASTRQQLPNASGHQAVCFPRSRERLCVREAVAPATRPWGSPIRRGRAQGCFLCWAARGSRVATRQERRGWTKSRDGWDAAHRSMPAAARDCSTAPAVGREAARRSPLPARTVEAVVCSTRRAMKQGHEMERRERAARSPIRRRIFRWRSWLMLAMEDSADNLRGER